MTAQMVIEGLVRGSYVVVGDTFQKEDLRGTKMRVASKGTVKCNGKGRCAGDHCVGLAVFVTSPETYVEEPSGATGWRTNTTKICLTHLLDEDGNSAIDGAVVIPEDVETPSVAKPRKSTKAKKARGRREKGSEEASPELVEELVVVEAPTQRSGTVVPPPGSAPAKDPVTWEMLAFAHQREDLNGLATYSRRLIVDNQALTLRMLELQQEIIDLQRKVIEDRAGIGV